MVSVRIMYLITTVTIAAVLITANTALLPITGTFLDPYYDNRLLYSNNVTLHFTCQQWSQKISQIAQTGIDLVVFQAVHDSAFGAYYPSNISYMTPWAGECKDVVGAVLDTPGIKVLLSCEWVHGETDSVTDPSLMNDRLLVLNELAFKYGHHPNFAGWYFASEAHISPYFTDGFMAYISKLASTARQLTPGKMIFISPYGTSSAVNDPTFVSQLQALDVDVIAYQDEVGCIRVSLPVVTSAQSFRTLKAAHDAANGPRIWANVESFTWKDNPNNVTSPLIPAAWPRLLSQIAAVSEYVEKIVTFSRQALFDPPGFISWGPPDGSARRQYEKYVETFLFHYIDSAIEAKAAQLNVKHQAIGASVFVDPSCSAEVLRLADLTDGITGALSPYLNEWSLFSNSNPGSCRLIVDLGESIDLAYVGARFLQVPQFLYVGGHIPAVNRNLTSYLPIKLQFFAGHILGNLTQIGSASTEWWEQERYDIRTEILRISGELGTARYISLEWQVDVPDWVDNIAPQLWMTMVDEVLVNPDYDPIHE